MLIISHPQGVSSYSSLLSMVWLRVPPTILKCSKWWEITTSLCQISTRLREPVSSIKLMSTLKDKSWERHSSWLSLMISKEELMIKSGTILLEKQMMADSHRHRFLLINQNSSRTKSRKEMSTLSVRYSHQLLNLNQDLLLTIILKKLWFLASKLWEVEARIQLTQKVSME